MEGAFRTAARCGINLTGCNEKGQGLVEYAFILVLVSVAVLGTLGLLGDELGNLYVQILDQWPS